MTASFRMGRLDHAHLRVPDRALATEWYCQRLGFEPVAADAFWAEGFDGGPMQLSADGGATGIALFEATADHPLAPNVTGIAFAVDAATFMAFVDDLPNDLRRVDGVELTPGDVVDFDLAWAIEFADPWGNRLELNCRDYDEVRQGLAAADITPTRYWPADLYPAWRAKRE